MGWPFKINVSGITWVVIGPTVRINHWNLWDTASNLIQNPDCISTCHAEPYVPMGRVGMVFVLSSPLSLTWVQLQTESPFLRCRATLHREQA